MPKPKSARFWNNPPHAPSGRCPATLTADTLRDMPTGEGQTSAARQERHRTTGTPNRRPAEAEVGTEAGTGYNKEQ